MTREERLVGLRVALAALPPGTEAHRLIDEMVTELQDELLAYHQRELQRIWPSLEPGGCKVCAPLACDDPDRHLGVPAEYTPLLNRGCRCGADFDGRDCMCFEDCY